MFSDAHCHLTLENSEDVAQAKGFVEQARKAGVGLLLAVGVTPETSEAAVKFAASQEGLYAGVGIHPWTGWVRFIDESTYQQLKGLASQPKVRVISEIGLDLARDPSTKDIQLQALRMQMRLAREMRLPINFHCRGAHDEMVPFLRAQRAQKAGGIIHGFNGTPQQLQDWLRMGFLISIGRSVLRPENTALHEAVKQIPLERLVLETDTSPRSVDDAGDKIDPSDVRHVAAKVAELRGGTAEEIGEIATRNLKQLLKLA